MHRIIQANIDWCKESLSSETDETKRAELTRLLAEQEAKLAKSAEPETEHKQGRGHQREAARAQGASKKLKSDPVLRSQLSIR